MARTITAEGHCAIVRAGALLAQLAQLVAARRLGNYSYVLANGVARHTLRHCLAYRVGTGCCKGMGGVTLPILAAVAKAPAPGVGGTHGPVGKPDLLTNHWLRWREHELGDQFADAHGLTDSGAGISAGDRKADIEPPGGGEGVSRVARSTCSLIVQHSQRLVISYLLVVYTHYHHYAV